MGKRLWVPIAVLILGIVVGAFLPGQQRTGVAQPPLFPAPPRAPQPGELGSAGPCGQRTTGFANPEAQIDERFWIFEPTSTAAAPTGGTCDGAARPTVFFAHGYFVMDPAFYDDLIRHWTSNGHIVVYANYNPVLGFLAQFAKQYEVVDAGFRAAARTSDRIDTANIGIAGHSFGGGMTPWLVQQAHSRGWGGTSLWFATLAQSPSALVGYDEIPMPQHARGIVIGFEDDFIVDNRYGVDVFEALTLPDANKEHLSVYSDGHGFPMNWATHHVPMTIFSASESVRSYAVHRPIDAISTCARVGERCDVDLTWMGEWSDGTEARRSLASDDPVDFGLVNGPSLGDFLLLL